MNRAQTARLKERFIEKFAKMGNITKACEAAGISRRVVYDWQEKDSSFLFAFNEANAIATEHLEAEAWTRATDGALKPVYQGGVLVGHVPEKSDTLLIFLLKARNPEKYRESIKTYGTVTGPNGGPVEVRQEISQDAMAAVIAVAEKAAMDALYSTASGGSGDGT